MTYFTATGAGEKVPTQGAKIITIQATGATSAGAGAATVDIEVSNDGTNFIDYDTFSLTLSTSAATAGLQIDAPWAFVRGNCTAISGIGAYVTLSIGI